MVKPLALTELPKRDLLDVFELIHLAGTSVSPPEFKSIVDKILAVFPVSQMVCGFGTSLVEIKTDGTPEKPFPEELFSLSGVYNHNWPELFLEEYIKLGLFNQDSHFIDVLLTQKPKVWIDFIRENDFPFDPVSLRGMDRTLRDLTLKHNLQFTTRHGMIDSNRVGSSFNFNFKDRDTAFKYSGLLQGLIPFLHHSLVRSFSKGEGIIAAEAPLTSREKEVLRWLGEGKTNRQVAKILRVSERTIKFHVQNLMRKFEASNRHHLVAKTSGHLTA